MNRTEHLLTCLAEECIETAQRITKALRFGLHEVQPGQSKTNAERITDEYSDLLAVFEMLSEEGSLDDPDQFSRSIAKQARVEEFMAYARKCGSLQ